VIGRADKDTASPYRNPRHPARQRLVPTVFAGIGLALAIAGTLASPEGPPVAGLAERISIPLPDWLIIAATVSLSLAMLIFLAMLVPWRRPRKKKGDDDFELYHEPQRVPPLLGVFLLLLALLPGAVLGGALFWLGQEQVTVTPGADAVGAARPPVPPALSPAAPHPEPPAEPASPITAGLFGTLALLIGFGSLGFVLWLRYGDTWLRRLPADFEELDAALGSAIDDSLDDLRNEPDPRAAIIKAYGHFERALSRAAMPRRPWETPVEFMRAILQKVRVPAAPVGTLTQLFEIARFSDHPLAAAERDSAWRSLIEIRNALEKEGGGRDAPTA
jgi:hypothetical protein